MNATRTVWGQVRTAKVVSYNPDRKCGLASDLMSHEVIFFELHRCRKVYARSNGTPFIGHDIFRQPPRIGNKILYIVDNRERIHDTEKKSAYVWGYRYFYLQSLQDQNGAMELEGALDGKITSEASAKPVRSNKNHQSALVTLVGQILATSTQLTPPTATATAVPDWSPGIPGLDAEGPTGESGEETSVDKSPEELATAAGGRNGGKKSKPGQDGWTDGRRNGRGHRQDRRWRY